MRINKLTTLFTTTLRNIFAFFVCRAGKYKIAQELSEAIRLGNLHKLAGLKAVGCRFDMIASLYGTLLHSVYRISDGNLQVIQFFLDCQANPLDRDHAGNTLLDTAVIEGRLDLCRLLLRNGVKLEVTNELGITTPIQKAIRYRQERILEYFLKFLSNHPDMHYLTTDVLKLVIEENQQELLELVLDYDIDVGRVYQNGGNLLHYIHSPEILNKLIKRGFDINQVDEFGVSLLAKLVMDNQDSLALTLLDWKPQLSNGVSEYSDLILAAAKHDNLSLLERLLAHGQGLANNDFHEWILIECIEDRLSLDVIKLLIVNGAHVNCRNHREQTPLMLAAKKNNPYYIRYLLRLGANPDLVDKTGRNALMHAIINRSEKCIMPLLTRSKDIFRRDHKGFDITLHCIVKGTELIANLLLAKGLELVQVFDNGQTSLMLAAMANNVELIELLLKLGMDVDAVDAKNRSALMYAAGNNLMTATHKLLEAGANPALVDINGRVAADLTSNHKIIKLLNCSMKRNLPVQSVNALG